MVGLNEWSKIVFALAMVSHGVQSQDFSYLGAFGPDHWGEQFTTCSGKHQSPINIDLVRAKNVSFPPIEMKGFNEVPNNAMLQNNGHTVVVTMDFKEHPTITGGPLNATYQLAQFHFHWGDDDGRGSEDLINNKSFPVELHMVFFNKNYGSFDKALSHVDGLVVLAYFYTISNETNYAYVGLSLLLEKIVTPDQAITYAYVPKLENLISDNKKNFFTYIGSLTTPPCSEVVTWIDFETPIPITSEQIKNFRTLKTKDNELLTHNYRPIQPLNGRVVYRNVDAAAISIKKNDRGNKNAPPEANAVEFSNALHNKTKKNHSNRLYLANLRVFYSFIFLIMNLIVSS